MRNPTQQYEKSHPAEDAYYGYMGRQSACSYKADKNDIKTEFSFVGLAVIFWKKVDSSAN